MSSFTVFIYMPLTVPNLTILVMVSLVSLSSRDTMFRPCRLQNALASAQVRFFCAVFQLTTNCSVLSVPAVFSVLSVPAVFSFLCRH